MYYYVLINNKLSFSSKLYSRLKFSMFSFVEKKLYEDSYDFFTYHDLLFFRFQFVDNCFLTDVNSV